MISGLFGINLTIILLCCSGPDIVVNSVKRQVEREPWEPWEQCVHYIQPVFLLPASSCTPTVRWRLSQSSSSVCWCSLSPPGETHLTTTNHSVSSSSDGVIVSNTSIFHILLLLLYSLDARTLDEDLRVESICVLTLYRSIASWLNRIVGSQNWSSWYLDKNNPRMATENCNIRGEEDDLSCR